MIKEGGELKKYLLTKCANVYYMEAHKNAPMPYIVYTLPSSFPDGLIEVFVLDIDMYSTVEQALTLEQLADDIKGNGNILNPTGLNKGSFYNNDVAFTLYLDGENRIPDTEPLIRRIRQTYQLRKI